MRRVLDITLTILAWCAVVAFVILGSLLARERRAAVHIGELRINIDDRADTRVVTREKITDWLLTAGVYPIVGRPLDSIDTGSIERLLESRPEVAEASAWTNLNGIASIRVTPRRPLFRMHTDDGHRFWYTTDGYILPDRGDYNVRGQLITGSVELPFPTTAAGSYADIQRANYLDYLERFTALEQERRSLTEQRRAARAAELTARNSGPKRFWSAARKKAFEVEKSEKIARAAQQQKNLTAALASLAQTKRLLKEKEQFSYQTHAFLPKLSNFVKSVEASEFWRVQMARIKVGGGVNGEAPQIEITPRLGGHVVVFGELDGTEGAKLDKLRIFYVAVSGVEYSRVDVRYKNQIICVH